MLIHYPDVMQNRDTDNRILLVEDHPLLREALAVMLDREPGFTVVAQAGSLAEARRVLRGIDVALVDLGLPDGDGVELIRELREANPRCENRPDCVVLVLTASLDRFQFARAVEAGAAGMLHKSAALEEVVGSIRRLCAGEALLSAGEVVELMVFASRQREESAAARAAIGRLTSREREVLQGIADGLDSKGVAQRLGITVETERNYVTSILVKLDVHSRLQALVFAIRHGLVKIRPPVDYQPVRRPRTDPVF